MPSTCSDVPFRKRGATKPTELMTSVTSEQLLGTSLQVHQTTDLLSTSARYAALQQRCPTDVVPAHIGHALCFKIVEEADKVPGKYLSWWEWEEVEEPIITTCLISFCFNVLQCTQLPSFGFFFVDSCKVQ